MCEFGMLQEKLHEECGIVGIYNNDNLDAAHLVYLALYALQHRGQISCGIAVNNAGVVDAYRDLGIVPEVFNPEVLSNLTKRGKGDIAMGHVRYSSHEFAERLNSQPLVMRYAKGTISLCNNGSLVNAVELREQLEHSGAVFQTGTDAELIAGLVARARLKTHSVEQAVNQVMDVLKGAYSFVLMSPKKLVAVRDPNGFRPLCIGKIENSYIVVSESCALDSLGAEFVRDIEPGEIVVIGEEGVTSIRDHCGKKTSMCIFEHVYFSRPDSVIDGASVHASRLAMGKFLAQEHPVEADIVIGVPDSGLDAALGYAKESGIPYGMGFIKNRYVGRTFIQDTQEQRVKSVHIKLNPLSAAVEGKRVVLVDDSIVRGTTSAHIVELLRKAGATEVHMRISSPEFLHPCYFGTDIDSCENLIACKMTVDEICKKIGADSLGYLSIEALRKVAVDSKVDFCDACFTGNYPVEVPAEQPKDKFSQKLDTLKKK